MSARGSTNESTPVLAAWKYIGSKYLNPDDVLLAAGVDPRVRAAHEALLNLPRDRVEVSEQRHLTTERATRTSSLASAAP